MKRLYTLGFYTRRAGHLLLTTTGEIIEMKTGGTNMEIEGVWDSTKTKQRCPVCDYPVDPKEPICDICEEQENTLRSTKQKRD